MRLQHRTKAYLTAVITMPLAAACGANDDSSGGPGDRDEVTLTVVTAFPSESENNDGFWMWVEALEEEAPWITVDYSGGPEVMEPTQMIEGVGSGVLDAASLPGDYYVSQAPPAEMLRFTPFTPTEERDEGIHATYEEFHAELLNVQYIGHTSSGAPQLIFLRDQELTDPDFSGLSIRTSSATSHMVSTLGGTPVDMPGAEIYTALERGAVDGTGWSSVGPVALGIHEQVQYEISPRFYDSITNLVINKDTWDGLDEESREAISSTMAAVEPDIFEHYGSLAQQEAATFREAGVELIEFTGAEKEELLRAAYEGGWDALDWGAITEAAPGAQSVRDAFESAYGADYESAVPGGATAPPAGD